MLSGITGTSGLEEHTASIFGNKDGFSRFLTDTASSHVVPAHKSYIMLDVSLKGGKKQFFYIETYYMKNLVQRV